MLTFCFYLVIPAKVRRLYDIANVLQSLKLIEKVHVTEERGRKTAFKWTGPAELPTIEGIGADFQHRCRNTPLHH